MPERAQYTMRDVARLADVATATVSAVINGSVHSRAYETMARRALPKPPTAIIATNNKLLLGVQQAVQERGLAIPREVSVLGFDDYLWNQHFSPSLTAMAQPAELRVRNSTASPAG